MWTDADEEVSPRPPPRIYRCAPRVVAEQSNETVRGVTPCWVAGFALSIILLLYVSGYL
jgi:hypothetical protein